MTPPSIQPGPQSGPQPSIDLNCDLGETAEPGSLTEPGSPADLALLDCITSANIACGGHAGDAATMAATLRAAHARGVAVGAHPSYPDRARFGRVRLDMTPDQIERAVTDQLTTLADLARAASVPLRHIKPHGALYHAAMTDHAIAAAIARACLSIQPDLILIGLAGAPALEQWRRLGLTVAAEAFADRLYEPDGSLRARTHPDALITDPAAAAFQALGIALTQAVITSDGQAIPLHAHTICIHSDTPGAAAAARAIRDTLQNAGLSIRPLSAPRS